MNCQHCGARMNASDADDARDAGIRLADLCPDCVDVLVWGGRLDPDWCVGRERNGSGHRCIPLSPFTRRALAAALPAKAVR